MDFDAKNHIRVCVSADVSSFRMLDMWLLDAGFPSRSVYLLECNWPEMNNYIVSSPAFRYYTKWIGDWILTFWLEKYIHMLAEFLFVLVHVNHTDTLLIHSA